MSTKTLMKQAPKFPLAIDEFFKPWREWFDGGENNMVSMPSVNVTENGSEYKVALAAPGLKKSDFNISLDDDVLTVSAEAEEDKEEKNEKYTRKEYNYSSFSRSFTLPDDVSREKIEATYDNGVLKLKLPKREEAKKMAVSKKIDIN